MSLYSDWALQLATSGARVEGDGGDQMQLAQEQHSTGALR